jgi:hypothetical protein
MACGCQTRKKRDLAYVRSLALKSVQIEQKDFQIYKLYLAPTGWIYDYEPVSPNRANVIEIVKYRP